MRPKTEPDPYFVLGVDRDVSEADLRAAFRELVAKYHPDKHQGNPLEGLAAEKMAEVNRAYETLSDPARRAEYDQSHGTWPRPGAPGSGTSVRRPRKPVRWLAILGLLLLLPLLIRILVAVTRPLRRGAAEVLAAARGTPLLGAIVAVVIVLLVFILVRRQRRGRRRGQRQP